MNTVLDEQAQQGFGTDQGEGNQYLTFLLNGEEYGVDILRVQEIKGWERVTPLPNTCDYILGVINLRGFVIPIVDLRKRFGCPPVEYSKTTVVIVLKICAAKGDRTMGFVVDAVSDVYALHDRQLRPPPDFVNGSRTQFVKGLATVENKMVILLDVDQLVQDTTALSAV